MSDDACPICRGDVYNVSASLDVCEKHESFFVTMCAECGKTCFSASIRLCGRCADAPVKPRGTGGKKDHRAALRANGLDGWG